MFNILFNETKLSIIFLGYSTKTSQTDSLEMEKRTEQFDQTSGSSEAKAISY